MRFLTNDALREARLARPSPLRSGQPLSRLELADAVSAYVFTNFEETICLDPAYIGKLERGHIRWPREHIRAALRATLRVDEDGDIGFFESPGQRRARTPPVARPVSEPRAASPPPRLTRDELHEAHMDLGAQLAHWRKAAGLTQHQFAERLCYSRSTVASVETGRHNIRREFWRRADNACGANGTLLAAADKVRELSATFQMQAADERHRRTHERAGEFLPAHAPERIARDGEALTTGAVNGGLTLSVTAVGAGGLRIVIDTGSCEPAEAASSVVDGARVYSIELARRARAGRLA
jgi:transcriptional regulator with XRE-family HTH domain